MNADTLNGIEKIRAQGFYFNWTTLGAGGWPEVNKFARDWSGLELQELDREWNRWHRVETVYADTQGTARAALEERWHLAEGIEAGRYKLITLPAKF